jgi:hypothetical protein
MWYAWCSSITRDKMKITLPAESAAMLIRAKQLSDKNFNSLIKESMVLLLEKYTKDQNVQHTTETNKRIT